MPNPTSHMFLIHDLFESNIESKTYLKFMILGSIVPDIRVITKIHRKKYDYSKLKGRFLYITHLYATLVKTLD